jgi:transcriptional regulator with XRE-family HTH domain
LSLRALVQQCGLSVNAISLIERGENSPTVSSLHLMATALGVPITDFFKDDHQQAVVFVSPESRLRSENNGIALESLGIGLRNQQLEPFLVTAAPHSGNFDQTISHAGEEFVYCLAGEVEYCVGEQSYQLQSGYSLLFDATLPHAFRNQTDKPAQLLIIFHRGENGHLARQLHMDPGQLALGDE